MSQKAVVLERVGEPLTLVHRPIPVPKAGEVLVKVLIAGINPHDSYSKSRGLFVENSLPTPLAADIAGEVIKLGPKVDKFKVGNVVFGFGDPQVADQLGTQQYCILDIDQAAKPPKSVSLNEAATFPLNAMTSFLALFHSHGLDFPPPFPDRKGSFNYGAITLVIIGAGTACGKFALQFTKLAGFGRVIAIASASNKSQLESLGATHVIDRSLDHDGIDKQIRAIVGDDLTYAYDCFGGANGGQTLGARLLSDSKRGTLAVLKRSGTVDESKIGDKHAGYERKPILCAPKLFKNISVPFWEILPKWIEDGTLSPTTWEVLEGLDADKINAALDGYQTGKTKVKPHFHL